ncbi:MAG: thioredoxin family protein [Candidatus Aminicenantales bacterium]
MKKRRVVKIAVLVLLGFLAFWIGACRSESAQKTPAPASKETAAKGIVLVTDEIRLEFSKHKITFIELGSVNCIPCRQMQPIMKEIAAQYPDQVLVVFYDVWKNPAPGEYYKIQLIPTQVFIDERGNELFRHVGLFPKEEILIFLKEHGVK